VRAVLLVLLTGSLAFCAAALSAEKPPAGCYVGQYCGPTLRPHEPQPVSVCVFPYQPDPIGHPTEWVITDPPCAVISYTRHLPAIRRDLMYLRFVLTD
jgi:hypothetical protein